LGLIEWELGFQVDRETAKGTLQRGFNVAVLSPHNTKAVPWEAWSGGEGQRLRLAANMGLADLIRSRTGTTLNLEVWDEPTQGLSPRGVADLLESLAQRARNEGRQIWIVDHRSYDFGGFAGTATIVKSQSGSRIRQSTV
jgi:DNA repair exonuclease SbcCD ATPase subunit